MVLLRRSIAAVATVLGLVVLAAVGWSALPASAGAATSDALTVEFYYGDGCPHCAAQVARMGDWGERFGVEIRSYEVWNDPANATRFREVAAAHGVGADAVPATFIAGRVWIGYSDSAAAQMEALLTELTAGRDPPPPGPSAPDVVSVPLLGQVSTATTSLLALTAAIALVDGVNPCSLWVLTLLLAFVLRTGDRRDLILVGVTFLSITTLVYGLFILGLFGGLNLIAVRPWVRVGVGAMALAFAAVNLKDFLWYGRGPSLSIPEARKPALYRRMRTVTAAGGSRRVMLTGTAALALGASIVELPCTAGFPMIWATTVAGREVAYATFLALLGVYLLIYLLDELAIVGTTAITLRATKLQERQGRALKLVSGVLAGALGGALVLAPDVLGSAGGALGLVAGALAVAALILLTDRSRRVSRPGTGRRPTRPPGGVDLPGGRRTSRQRRRARSHR